MDRIPTTHYDGDRCGEAHDMQPGDTLTTGCMDFPAGTGTCITNDGTGLWCDNCEVMRQVVAILDQIKPELMRIHDDMETPTALFVPQGVLPSNLRRLDTDFAPLDVFVSDQVGAPIVGYRPRRSFIERDRVIAQHEPFQEGVFLLCRHDGADWPCPTLRAMSLTDDEWAGK